MTWEVDMRRFVTGGVGLVLSLLASTPGAVAQEEVVIPDDPNPPCTIEFIPAGPELSRGPEGLLEDTWPSGLPVVEPLPGRRIAMAEVFANGIGVSDRFFVASRDGSGGHWVGRRGEGPGEYRFVRLVEPEGERLHVFDPMRMLRTVLDATTFGVVHTNHLEPLQFGADGLVLDDSTYVINGTMYSRDRAGYVLHLFNGEGEVVRSFDEIPVAMPGEEPIRGQLRELAPARNGGVWSGWRSEYRLDLWDVASGTRRRSVVRNAPWFPPHNGTSSRHPDRPNNPVIANIMEDSEGRLWVRIAMASDRWSECWEKASPSEHPEAPEYTARPGCPSSEVRIEVLDPEAGRVLAAQTLPRNFGLLRLTAGEAFAVSADEFGFATVRQWRPALRPVNNSQGRQC